MRHFILLPVFLLLSGCVTDGLSFLEPALPKSWSVEKPPVHDEKTAEKLEGWWMYFNDPVLSRLVELALVDSPDRKIAEARVLEARGVRRTSRSSLFPQIGLSGEAGRQDTGYNANDPDDFYEAGFDASFEIDVFGANRSTLAAADEQLLAAEADYHDVTLSLIAEVVRTYIDFRAAQNQYRIANKNLISQEKTQKLITDLFDNGEAPRLDVERAGNLVSTTRASLPEFKRLEENARLRLSILTGHMPDELLQALQIDADIPDANAIPVLMTPAGVLAQRPDVKAAEANLRARTKLSEAAVADFFPSFNLRGFYGIADSALVSSATIWNVALGAAVNLLDFGRIEGQVDAARAREMQAFELYRKTVISAVVEVETALNDYAHILERRTSLDDAFQSADKALSLSQTLYKEGEVSFLDVLDAQRRANSAEATAVEARAAQAESLARLYKSLGVY